MFFINTEQISNVGLFLSLTSSKFWSRDTYPGVCVILRATCMTGREIGFHIRFCTDWFVKFGTALAFIVTSTYQTRMGCLTKEIKKPLIQMQLTYPLKAIFLLYILPAKRFAWPTTLAIILWNLTMIQYRSDSPQVKQNLIPSTTNLVLELDHELLNDLKLMKYKKKSKKYKSKYKK